MAIQSIGLNLQQQAYWERKIWKQMRTRSLIDQLASEGANSVVQRITELNNTAWGNEAILTMVPDDTSFGVVGDSQLEDREAGITAHNEKIQIDQFRKAFKNVGKYDDRTAWFKFAQQASDQLAYWAADIKDRMAMNALAGVGFEYEVDGSLRDSSCEWNHNKFAGDVTPPSPNRHLRWDVGSSASANTLVSGTAAATTNVEPSDIPTWNMFIDMRAELPLMRIKPVRGMWGNGEDLYVAIVHPRTMQALKKDPTFQQNLRDAMQRGSKNPIFMGAETYMVDGILLISHRYAYTTLGASNGNKWGAGGDVDGARTLFLGAQALGIVDLQAPKIVTSQFDYENRVGIACSLMWGCKKLKWPDQYANNASEDFSVVAVDHACPPGATHYTI